MTNVSKLSQCGKSIQSDDFKTATNTESVAKYDCTGGSDQNKEKKDVTTSLNEIIFKQLFF